MPATSLPSSSACSLCRGIFASMGRGEAIQVLKLCKCKGNSCRELQYSLQVRMPCPKLKSDFLLSRCRLTSTLTATPENRSSATDALQSAFITRRAVLGRVAGIEGLCPTVGFRIQETLIIIRIGFGGIFCYNYYNKDPPLPPQSPILI